jgi:hypothetical protein
MDKFFTMCSKGGNQNRYFTYLTISFYFYF